MKISNEQGIQYPIPLNAKALTQDYFKYNPNVLWYKKVQRIEDYFDVLFLFPELRTPTNEEEQVVACLEEIMERGDLNLLCPDIIESWFFAHKQEELIALCEAIKKKIKIGFHFQRRLKIRLFNIEVDLKECDIYCNGAHPKDYNQILRKINTWESNDRRTAEIEFTDGMDLWIQPRHLHKAETIDPSEGLVMFNMPPQAEVPFPDVMKDFIIEY